MALARLESLLKPYLLHYFDPTGQLREPQELDVNCTSASQSVSRVYMKNKALSIFGNLLPRCDLLEYAVNPERCIKDNIRFVHQDDFDHESYHKTKDDFEILHWHILKGTYHFPKNTEPYLNATTPFKPKEMTEAEVKCIIATIKLFETEELGLCKDGKVGCMLTDADARKIIDEYSSYLRRKKRAPILEAKVDAAYKKIEEKFISFFQSFIIAVCFTFLDKYIVPYFINKGIHPKTAKRLCDSLKTPIDLVISNSNLTAGVNIIIRNLLTTILTQSGIHLSYVERISNVITTAFAVTKDPFALPASLLDLTINGLGASAGQELGEKAAYILIRKLPKLRTEPDISPQEASLNSGQPVDESLAQSSETLRRRNVNL